MYIKKQKNNVYFLVFIGLVAAFLIAGTGKVGAHSEAVVNQSSCGGLSQQAENGRISGQVEVKNNSLGRYIQMPSSRWGSAARVDYCVNIAQAGIYQVKGWVFGDSRMSAYFEVDGKRHHWDLSASPTRFSADWVNDRYKADPVQLRLGVGQHRVSIVEYKGAVRPPVIDRFEFVLVEPLLPAGGCTSYCVE